IGRRPRANPWSRANRKSDQWTPDDERGAFSWDQNHRIHSEVGRMSLKDVRDVRKQGCNYIDGSWQPITKNAYFENYDPATGQLLSVYPESRRQDVDRAIEAAAHAFSSWRLVPVAKRGEILLRAMKILESHKETYARAMTREMGKVLTET